MGGLGKLDESFRSISLGQAQPKALAQQLRSSLALPPSLSLTCQACPCLQDEKPFVSAKKVMNDMGEPYASGVELASFHTVSKGFLGEWGAGGKGRELDTSHNEECRAGLEQLAGPAG